MSSPSNSVNMLALGSDGRSSSAIDLATSFLFEDQFFSVIWFPFANFA
jgi:hypothetical protein